MESLLLRRGEFNGVPLMGFPKNLEILPQTVRHESILGQQFRLPHRHRQLLPRLKLDHQSTVTTDLLVA